MPAIEMRANARAAAGELTDTATAVVRLLVVSVPVVVALSGGVLVADRWYRGAVSRRLRGRVRVGMVRVVAEPAVLAARAGRRRAVSGRRGGVGRKDLSPPLPDAGRGARARPATGAGRGARAGPATGAGAGRGAGERQAGVGRGAKASALAPR
jgi:hypothetical protein